MPTANALLEVWVLRSITAALKAALAGVRVQEIGARRGVPEDGPNEWVSVDPLAFEPFASRRTNHDGTQLFQIGCFAKFGELNGASTQAPFVLAGRVRAALEKTDILIKQYGETVETFAGVLSLQAAGQQYLGENAIGIDFPANVHALVLTFRGTLTAA